jgi:hypothetical protein
MKRLEIEEAILPEPVDKTVFINMDEVPLQFSSTGSTYDFRGAKEIGVQSTSGSKRRFTLVLTICSDGTCLPPMVIFKGRKDVPLTLKQKFDKKCLIGVNNTGWMTNQKMKYWITNILANFEKKKDTKYFVVLDQFAAHISMETEAELTKHGFGLFVIPGGCTGLLQPLDTCINRPLKVHIGKFYNEWIKSKTTETQKPKYPPSYELVITWLIDGLLSLSEDLILKSFKHCGKFYSFVKIYEPTQRHYS